MDVRTAWGFATRNAGYDGAAQLMAALVPVERVIGTAWTGYGTDYEQEFVVLGSREMDWRTLTWRVNATVPGIPDLWSDRSAITFETARSMLYEKMEPPMKKHRSERQFKPFKPWPMPRISGPTISPDADPDNADWLKRMPEVPAEFRERVRRELLELGWTEEQIAALPLFRPI